MDEIIENKILQIYSSIQMYSFKSTIFNYISSLFEFANIILVTDIVFNYKRDFINITFPFYFLSPVFYLESILNKLVKDNDLNLNCILLDIEDYKNDQINILIHKYFTSNIYSQNCFKDYKLIRIIILILLFASFIIHIIDINNTVLAFFKYIFSFIMYFCFRTINLVILIIFNREVIIQFSDYYDSINMSFILGFAMLILLFLIYTFFMSLFIYAFFENSDSYLHNQNFVIQEIFLHELSSILIILRLNLKHSIVVEFFWIMFIIRYFVFKLYDMFLIIDNSKFFKIYQISMLLLISYFIERLIVVCLIKWHGDIKVFKIFDLSLLIFLFFLLMYLFYNHKKFLTLYLINKSFKNKSSLFFYGLSQIFRPITIFFEIKFKQGKISGKEREIVDTYINYFKNNLFKNGKDFEIIGDLKEKLFSLYGGKIKNLSSSNRGNLTNEEDSEKIIYTILLFFLKYFKKNIQNNKNEFNRKAIEILNYYKIQLFFIMDDKTFRAQYFLQNFRYSKIFIQCPFIAKCIFKSIRTSLLALERKSEDNSMASIIIFQELNNQYFEILKCFKGIINNLNESKRHLFQIIDTKSGEIKSALNEIIEINKHADDEFKLRTQPEFDKFQLFEEILFNDNTGKNFDFYDCNSLDIVVEKNDSFLILFEKNQFIIKKAPLPFYEYTKRKTHKLKDKNLTEIFPFHIAKYQMKIIKKHLLKDRHYTLETVFEDLNGYIIGTKLHFSMLPTFKGQIYIICKIEIQKDFEVENYALFEKENSAIKFGTFFKDYFGINSENSSIPIIQIFGIKNFSFKVTEKEYSINFSKFLKSVTKNFEKFYSNSDKSIHEKNLSKLQTILNGSKKFTLEIKIKNKFIEGNQDLYLLQFNILELIKNKKQKKNILESAETQNGFSPSIRDTASVASAISTRLHKENAWNISTQAKKKQKSENNIFSTISFCYSVFLIALAIFICIYTKIYSNSFKKDYTNISVFRKNNMNFVYGQFSVSNVITKKLTGDPYDDLFAAVKKKFPDFNFGFYKFYLDIFQNTSIDFFTYQNQFKKQFNKISKHNHFYNVLYQTFQVFDKNYGNTTITYFDSFDLIFTNYYTISQSLEDILRFRQITFEEIPDNIVDVPEPNKTTLEIIYNYPTFFSIIENVIFEGKEYFNDSFIKFRFIIYLFFILFFAANLFGIVIILLSINLSTNILRKISKQIISITHKQLKSLKKKIKYGKLLLLNEKKPSLIIDELKRQYAYNRAIKKKKFNQAFIDGNSNKMQVEIEENDDYIPVVDLKKKEKKYYFRIFIISIENIILSALLFSILLIVTFPIMKTLFSKIETQKKLADHVEDLNIFLVHFLIKVKIAILFNSTYEMDDLINKISLQIYNNYTEFGTIIEQKKEYLTLIDEAGEVESCKIVLNNYRDKYYYNPIIQVCTVDIFFQARYSVKLSGYLSKIRTEYLAFLNDRHRDNFMFTYFAGYKLQVVNLFEYIFYMTFLGDLAQDYIKPDLENMINNLTNFILIIFIIMIILQIFNYIQGAFIILDKFVQIIEVYNVIGKFFETNEINEKEKEKEKK